MLDRFRAFLDRPLDPRAGRAMLALAAAILVGFAALFAIGAGGGGRRAVPDESATASTARRSTSVSPPPEATGPRAGEATQRVRRQDPQDEKGSSAGRRVARALDSHRALQHVPYRRGRLAIHLAGARGGRAVLRVSAPTVAAARRGWHRFLRRYRDSGRAYVPIFKSTAGRSGTRGRA